MKSIRKSMWGMYWKLHDKRKRLAASLKGYLEKPAEMDGETLIVN